MCSGCRGGGRKLQAEPQGCQGGAAAGEGHTKATAPPGRELGGEHPGPPLPASFLLIFWAPEGQAQGQLGDEGTAVLLLPGCSRHRAEGEGIGLALINDTQHIHSVLI